MQQSQASRKIKTPEITDVKFSNYEGLFTVNLSEDNDIEAMATFDVRVKEGNCCACDIEISFWNGNVRRHLDLLLTEEIKSMIEHLIDCHVDEKACSYHYNYFS